MEKREYYEKKVTDFLGQEPSACDVYRQRIIEFMNQMDETDERFLRQICTMTKLHMERK